MDNKWLISLFNHCFPNWCYSCGISLKSTSPLCKGCLKQLKHPGTACKQCGCQLLHQADKCGKCLKRQPFFDRTIACFLYQDLITELIHRYKFHHQLHLAPLFAMCLKHVIRREYNNQCMPEVIIPVPLHRHRLQQRGFNQCVEVAKSLKTHLNIPVDPWCIKKHKTTPPQHQLKLADRTHNLKKAFKVMSLAPPSAHVAILDDIMTTGSTVNELSKTLKQSGVTQIDIWCIARAI